MHSFLYFWRAIFSNQILMGGVFGWFSAQFLKTILYAIINKEWDLSRFWGDGGMPSAHSSTVSCMAVSAAIVCGPSSPVFALAAILAFITMRDAMGVRLETGKQAVILNELIRIFSPDNPSLPEERLKEFVGHTPTQVVAGGILGVAAAGLLNLFYM